jgi:transposase-like protein
LLRNTVRDQKDWKTVAFKQFHFFDPTGSAQRFLSTHAAVYNIFNVQRHLTSASTHRAFRASAMNSWRAAVTVA